MYWIPVIPSNVRNVIGYIKVGKRFLSAKNYLDIFVSLSRPKLDSPFQYLAMWPWINKLLTFWDSVSACVDESNSCEDWKKRRT